MLFGSDGTFVERHGNTDSLGHNSSSFLKYHGYTLHLPCTRTSAPYPFGDASRAQNAKPLARNSSSVWSYRPNLKEEEIINHAEKAYGMPLDQIGT